MSAVYLGSLFGRRGVHDAANVEREAALAQGSGGISALLEEPSN